MLSPLFRTGLPSFGSLRGQLCRTVHHPEVLVVTDFLQVILEGRCKRFRACDLIILLSANSLPNRLFHLLCGLRKHIIVIQFFQRSFDHRRTRRGVDGHVRLVARPLRDDRPLAPEQARDDYQETHPALDSHSLPP